MIEDRDMRQREIIPPEKLAKSPATVIGVGAVGRQVALQLAAIGVPQIQLVDSDVVEAVNLAPQGYFESDLGKFKVDATAHMCRGINSEIDVITYASRFRRSMDHYDCIFMCVDSITDRKFIHQSLDHYRFFCDGRMSSETIRIVYSDPLTWDRYANTLFDQSEAVQGSCTAKSTIFTANIAAGLMVQQYSRYLRGMPIEEDMVLNLLSSELTVVEPEYPSSENSTER